MSKEDKVSEIIKHYPVQKIGLDDFYGKQTVINMLNEAINLERSSESLCEKGGLHNPDFNGRCFKCEKETK